MIRTRLFALSLVLALAAGPVAAACGDCCPQDGGELAMASAAACCGDCAETLDRVPERPSAAFRATSSNVSAPAVAVDLAAAPAPIAVIVDALPVAQPAASSPPRAFAPLRL